jgi:hypothetical protein
MRLVPVEEVMHIGRSNEMSDGPGAFGAAVVRIVSGATITSNVRAPSTDMRVTDSTSKLPELSLSGPIVAVKQIRWYDAYSSRPHPTAPVFGSPQPEGL